MTLRVGLLVNPIAGLGGPTGDKGSDDLVVAGDARSTARDRAARLVAMLQGADLDWITVPGDMGVDGVPTIDVPATRIGATSREDTRRLAPLLRDAGIDILLFAGGDGTATDIAAAVGDTVACLGIPAGVKITSPVFAQTIEGAAALLAALRPGFESVGRDVTDLDEEAYRDGVVDVRLTGSLRVPLSPFVQGGKTPMTVDAPLDGLVDHVISDIPMEAIVLVGAGSVCQAVKQELAPGQGTLLGVDAIRDGKYVARDLDADDTRIMMDELDAGTEIRLVLSLIGGQGALFGRGTQVIPADVVDRLGWDRILVAAPPEKLLGLPGIIVDTGDPQVDAAAPRYFRVIAGFNETRMVRRLTPGQDSSDDA